MALGSFFSVLLIHIGLFVSLSFAEDPYAFYNFEVSYITASPLGVPQQVIAINDKFPGPTINVTTNYNVVVNVRNKLDESLLITCWKDRKMYNLGEEMTTVFGMDSLLHSF
ncbi:hypothetical protein TIFTF001_003784 [Ficus carica]|uniref:Plastocyanin-like domain-containing protein n=1 Tax=Ficus carica TaxID=3494 RepID=A0AA87ZGC8_FICCA|nr:hypothetical protein TIFTF001_003784 [Ficus carica]